MRRLAILAQFDPGRGLPVHVRLHLERLRPVARRLILVSNSPLSGAAAAEARAVADLVIERANTGFDFAAWRDALAAETPADWDEILLTNSSLVGPLWPLEPLLDRMARTGADLWGLVRSREYREHLQSFFLVFRGGLPGSAAFADFWRGVEDAPDKATAIGRYELGLSHQFEASGFRTGEVVFDLPFPRNLAVYRRKGLLPFPLRVLDANKRGKQVLVPMALVRAGVPYLKSREALARTPRGALLRRALRSDRRIDYPLDAVLGPRG